VTDQEPGPDPWRQFAALLIGSDHDPSPDADDLYAGLSEPDAFALALHLAAGGTLGVPDDYQPDATSEPEENAPRAPRPDKSQGRHARPERDPRSEFGNLITDALNRPYPSRWR
jgi:hypothetical protein